MSLKTNILRLQLEGQCFVYLTHFSLQLRDQDIAEIESHIETLDNNLIYTHPYLYANNELNVAQLDILLSRGELAVAEFQFIQKEALANVLPSLCAKILKCLNFLNYAKISTCFNPFEEKNGRMPGLYLEPVLEPNYVGITYLPVSLIMEPPIEISSAKILLNYSKGVFYERGEIVRVDKSKNLIHFRNGEAICMLDLRKGTIKDMAGLELAQKVRKFSERVKENCKQFLTNWGIKLDSSFLTTTASLVSVGSVGFRNNQQKLLSELTYPMARNAFNHAYRSFYNSVVLQGQLVGQFIIVAANVYSKQARSLIKQYEAISLRMGLQTKFGLISMNNLDSMEEMYKLTSSIGKESKQIYILMTSRQATNGEDQCIRYFKQQLIARGTYFHILQYSHEEQQDQLDIVAMRSLTVLYCKLRLLPWKIKNLPFGDRPAIVCNINVQEMADGTLSVAVVSSMNSFFSKFCCYHAICQPEREHSTIYNLILEALNKFRSVHNIFPFRLFVYRTGFASSLEQQSKLVKGRLPAYYQTIKNPNNTTVTYIQLRADHPFRTFVQTDQNYLSKHTVKKTQLLTCFTISGRPYLQLEFEQPPLQLNILDIENDPAFIQKVLELTAKLCYGSVGNDFGRGTGFLGYAAKLNQYKQFNLNPWAPMLQDGVMLFL